MLLCSFPISPLHRVIRANHDLRDLLETSGTGAKSSLMSLGTRVKVQNPSGRRDGSTQLLHLLHPLPTPFTFLLPLSLHPVPPSLLLLVFPHPFPAFLFLLPLFLWEQQKVSKRDGWWDNWWIGVWMGLVGRVGYRLSLHAQYSEVCLIYNDPGCSQENCSLCKLLYALCKNQPKAR